MIPSLANALISRFARNDKFPSLALRAGIVFVFSLYGLTSAAQGQTQKASSPGPDHAAKMTRGLVLFKKHIRPVLVGVCLRCHGGEQLKSELDLSDRAGLLRGGSAGPAIVPGKASESLLLKLLRHERSPHMPKGGKQLPKEVIARFADWIDLGAPYDEPLIARKKKAPSWTERVVSAEDRQLWSLQPLKRAEPPTVKEAGWCRTPVDRFILAKLEQAGIRPNPQASRRALIRRVYFDLLGLPPSPEEVQRFLDDPAPDAYEKLIDRLLDSPHYGERWARYWLDLARFAESHGFEHDYDRPNAYHYRDFVIKAFNRDLPFTTFVQWQLAGDEIAPDNPLALMATGFLAAGVHSTQITKNEVEKHRYDEMDDMLATTGTALLGLTIGCARCHDHKYDPVPQADYYRMLATFTTTVRSLMEINLDPAGYQKAKAAFDKEHAPLAAVLKKYETEQLPLRLIVWERSASGLGAPAPILAILKMPAPKRTADQKALLAWWFGHALDPEGRRLYQQVRDHLRQAPQPALVKLLVATEGLPAIRLHTQGADFFPETYFLRRGDPNNKQGIAKQSFLQVLMTAPEGAKHWQKPPPRGWHTSYRRRALAEWITDVDHGAGKLLARVIVNRLWQHHLGRGIVATPSDFGTRGEPPTHPELLDWLATELMRNGWRLKPLHKLIMTSAVYRESAQADEIRSKADRGNNLCWRWTGRRLEAEVIRDGLLAVGGLLDKRMFGPGTLDEASRRRSIYFTIKRSKLIPMMQVFDAPEALTGVADRPTTTIAPQALLLMNNPQVRACAHGFARRLADRRSLEEAVRLGFLTALARPPTAEELADSVAFIRQQEASYRGSNRREMALADFCQVLMCLNEFIYVD
jgi:cytochrome c553